MSIVTSKLRNSQRALNSLPEIRSRIVELDNDSHNYSMPIVNVIELHLTDICDLKCGYCSYRSNNRVKRNVFNYDHIQKILELKPKAIILAGGGEPTLYNDKGHLIDDVIDIFNANDISVGLITNGNSTKGLSKNLSWIRLSLDAIGKLYFNLKKGSFEKRVKFINACLKSTCNHIGIGFLYSKNNLNELINACEFIHSNFKDHRVNIQFRPICLIQSCDCPSANYSINEIITPNREVWWSDNINKLREKFHTIKGDDPNLYNFIIKQTNLKEVLFTEIRSSELNFTHCYSAFSRWIIRADGNIYPCVMKATNNNCKSIGNIYFTPPEELRRKQSHYFNLHDNYCKGSSMCCKLGGVTNEIIEDNIINNDNNPIDCDKNNYFF